MHQFDEKFDKIRTCRNTMQTLNNSMFRCVFKLLVLNLYKEDRNYTESKGFNMCREEILMGCNKFLSTIKFEISWLSRIFIKKEKRIFFPFFSRD